MIILDLNNRTLLRPEEMPPTVLCLGNFDGVHRGHMALMRAALEQAARLRTEMPDVQAGAWCFAVPPRRYLCGKRQTQITSLCEKADLMASLGLRYLCLGDFRDLHNMSPEDFVRDVLQELCHCVSTVCGFNHRFGRGGEGTSAHLEAIFGDRALTVPPVEDSVKGGVISSSRIRALLLNGQMAEAVRLLGHPFLLRAPVMHGKALGRTIGLPTINQNFPAGHLIPAHGIYATRVSIAGQLYIGVTNVGRRPSVQDGEHINCETHILDFNGSLYGKVITVEFYQKLRYEKKFDGLQALMEAIRADALSARHYFEQTGGDKA